MVKLLINGKVILTFERCVDGLCHAVREAIKLSTKMTNTVVCVRDGNNLYHYLNGQFLSEIE